MFRAASGINIPRRVANSPPQPRRFWAPRLIAALKCWHSALPLATLGSIGAHDPPHNGLSSGALFRNDTLDSIIPLNYLIYLCLSYVKDINAILFRLPFDCQHLVREEIGRMENMGVVCPQKSAIWHYTF
jgi:hypothetical protein